MNKYLGIDLGTTYSCVSYIDDSGRPVVLKNSEGELTTASVVFFETATSVVVGSSAKESATLYPGEVVSYAKREMGVPGAGWNIYGLMRTPEEISSYILRKLVNDANQILRSENKILPDETITDVVITCPAYFGIAEREATRKAGEIAGLNVIGIINEPTAAAITYGLTDATDDEQVVLVYDLGGGTFDTTMIEIKEDEIRVICTGGDQGLGGKQWDDRIIQFLASEFIRQTQSGEDILTDPETLQELTLAAERAKKMLSAREKAPISINYKGARARVELTREHFNTFTTDLLERTILLTGQMLDEAAKKGYDITDITEILLVGGSTRMPQVQQRVEEVFGVPVKIYDPDEAVAKGAALYASRQAYFEALMKDGALKKGITTDELRSQLTTGETTLQAIEEIAEVPDAVVPQEDVAIINVTSRSFGTIAYENKDSDTRVEVLYNLILRNTELPAFESRRFYTVVPNQKMVNIRVLESLSTDRYCSPQEGTAIGETVLELPSNLPVGSPLEIQFRLTESGLLELCATELLHGGDIVARFETFGGGTEPIKETKQRLDNSIIL